MTASGTVDNPGNQRRNLMLNHNEQVNAVNAEITRPLGRVTARELSAEEVASVSGGFTGGYSNFNFNPGDIDMLF
jgi:hypothetical protein